MNVFINDTIFTEIGLDINLAFGMIKTLMVKVNLSLSRNAQTA